MINDVHQQLSNNANLPLLRIPSLSAPKSDANDWQARFQTAENTFAVRIGQICNTALDCSIIACNENTAPEERRRAWYELTHRERLETFFAAIDWDTVDSPMELPRPRQGAAAASDIRSTERSIPAGASAGESRLLRSSDRLPPRRVPPAWKSGL